MRAGSMACSREIDTRDSGLKWWQLTRMHADHPRASSARRHRPSRFRAVERSSRAGQVQKSSDRLHGDQTARIADDVRSHRVLSIARDDGAAVARSGEGSSIVWPECDARRGAAAATVAWRRWRSDGRWKRWAWQPLAAAAAVGRLAVALALALERVLERRGRRLCGRGQARAGSGPGAAAVRRRPGTSLLGQQQGRALAFASPRRSFRVSAVSADSILFSECSIETCQTSPPETASVSGRFQAARCPSHNAGQASALWACACCSASATVGSSSPRCSRILQPSRCPL